jgi:hypothetical protein
MAIRDLYPKAGRRLCAGIGSFQVLIRNAITVSNRTLGPQRIEPDRQRSAGALGRVDLHDRFGLPPQHHGPENRRGVSQDRVASEIRASSITRSIDPRTLRGDDAPRWSN